MAKTRSKHAEAIQMLIEDHERVQKAFRQFEKMDRSDVDACQALIEEVCSDLKLHTTLEEEIFYPAVREVLEEEEILNEAAVEHETARMLIEQLENMTPDDPNYFATFTVLGEYVKHHIKEEEHEMFPEAEKSKELDMEALGAKMHERRQALAGAPEQSAAQDRAR
jgi:hemerythrin-like domain-containing protein